MDEATSYTLARLDGYRKFKKISLENLAKKWGKTYSYIYRRLSGKVELTHKDMLDLIRCLEIPLDEATDIFFGYELRNT